MSRHVSIIKQNPPCPRCPSAGPVVWSGDCFNCENCGRLWLIETRADAATLVERPVALQVPEKRA